MASAPARSTPILLASISSVSRFSSSVSKNAMLSSTVSRKQQGSGSSASAIRLPVRRSVQTRSATASIILAVMASGAPLSLPFGLNAPGTVEMLPSIPSGRMAARTAALSAVNATRSGLRQSGR